MRSGVPSLALGSSMNSVIAGKGCMVPGLSVSLRCSNTTGDAIISKCAGAEGGTGTVTGTTDG